MKKISLISPCYNEELNIRVLYSRVRDVIDTLPNYEFEYIFIDNASTDKTVEILNEISKVDYICIAKINLIVFEI